MIRTKYNFNLKDRGVLLDLTLQNLDKIFSHRKRLTRKGIFEQINDFDKEKYKKCVKNELAILERIKFDGYMYLLFELSNYAKERNIFCEFFGSIQYSLSAYLLGITSSCELCSSEDFINFIPFTKDCVVHVVCENDRKYEFIEFVNYKYANLLKDKDENLEFIEALKINFVDLGIEPKNNLCKDEAKFLGLKVLEVDVNLSSETTRFTKEDEIILGFDSIGLSEYRIDKILTERGKNGDFKDFDDFCKRVDKELFTDQQLKHIERSFRV